MSGDGNLGSNLTLSGGRFLLLALLYSLNSSSVNSSALLNLIAIFYYS